MQSLFFLYYFEMELCISQRRSFNYEKIDKKLENAVFVCCVIIRARSQEKRRGTELREREQIMPPVFFSLSHYIVDLI